MIIKFKNIADAESFCKKVHNFLLNNCPLYNAVKWQEPEYNKDELLFYVQLPQEYEKTLYKDSDKISLFTKTEYDKSIISAKN